MAFARFVMMIVLIMMPLCPTARAVDVPDPVAIGNPSAIKILTTFTSISNQLERYMLWMESR